MGKQSKSVPVTVRFTQETYDRLLALVETLSATLGVRVSQSDALTLGLKALERDYSPAPAAGSGAAEVKGKKGGAK